MVTAHKSLELPNGLQAGYLDPQVWDGLLLDHPEISRMLRIDFIE